MKKTSAGKEKVPLRVLVLDDLPTWRRLVKSILESQLGISAFVAANGQEALEILESTPVDVVVSDLNMPGMSGIQFLHRARPAFPRTKFVIMTADDVTCTLSKECIARGAFALVAKDEIDPNLLELLRNLQEPN
jgi:CheY-like chemotaxis protein